jgi:hypothetical protein
LTGPSPHLPFFLSPCQSILCRHHHNGGRFSGTFYTIRFTPSTSQLCVRLQNFTPQCATAPRCQAWRILIASSPRDGMPKMEATPTTPRWDFAVAAAAGSCHLPEIMCIMCYPEMLT